MNIRHFKIILLVLFWSNVLMAGSNTGGLTIVPVGKATLEKDRFYFQSLIIKGKLSRAQISAINEFNKLFKNNFRFYRKKFQVVDSLDGQKGQIRYAQTPRYAFWASQKINYFVRIRFKKESRKLYYLIEVFDIARKVNIYQKNGVLEQRKVRRMGHHVSNDIYRSITGKKSIFQSRIVFVSDITSRGSEVYKELYIMDFDGANIRRLTSHKGLVVSPSISYDGTKILYSVIKHRKRSSNLKKRNVNLYLYDLKTFRTRIVSSRAGINSGATFMPDGIHIALTLSFGGNAEIYRMNLGTGKLSRITRHFGVDVDPSITRDGTLMTFLSNRPGKAMIYTLDPRGVEKNVKRIGHVGRFNATPRFSPDGKTIAFSSWLDNRFDIFRINSDGTGLYRLTKNFGSNEDPTWSNDGQFIAFSSQRVISSKKAIQNIYIMDSDGDIIGGITKRFGNCITPRWSK